MKQALNKLQQLTDFEQKVLKAVRMIPQGKVSTYQLIARKIGHPRSARAVGNSLNINPYPIKIPCHRVVKSDGSLGGYANGSRKKLIILQQEGVEFSHFQKIKNKNFLYKF